MANNVSGKVVNEIQFKINKKSWDNLTQFQNKITNIKRQLSGLKGSIRVGAVVSEVNKVTNAVARGTAKIKKAQLGTSRGDISHLFPTDPKNKASNTLFADMLRKEEALAQRAKQNIYAAEWKEAERLQKQQKRLDADRAKARGKIEQQISYKTVGAQLAFNRREVGLDGRGVKELGIGRERAMNMIADYNQQLRAGTLTIREYNTRVNHAIQKNMRLARSNTKAGMSFRDLRTELVQMTAAYTAFSAGVNIFNTGRKIEGLEAGMKVFSGSDANVRANMTWVEETSRKLGANFLSMAENYTKFSIVARNKLTQDEIKTLFQSVTEYATVMQTDQQQFNRAMTALNQIEGLALQ